MNKRGSYLFTATVLAAMMAFLVFLIISYNSKPHDLSNGKNEFLLLRTYYEGEKLMYYADVAAQQSLIESFVLMAQSGGIQHASGEFGGDTGCGTYRGVTLLNNEKTECFSTSVDMPQNLKQIFAQFMNRHMANYPGEFFFTKPEDLSVSTDSGIRISNTYYSKPLTFKLIVKEDGDDIEFGGSKWTFWPVDGPVTDCYGGPRGIAQRQPELHLNPWHEGIDFGVPEGTPIRAPDKGEVYSVCACPIGDRNCCSGFGNTLVIKHDDALYTRYAHLAKFEKQKDDDVAVGDVIGFVGLTGNIDGAHLHFSTYTSSSTANVNDYSQNPSRWLPKTYNGKTNPCPADGYTEP